MTIGDEAARNRMEHAARPASFGHAYYGPRLAELGRERERGARRIVALTVGLAIGAGLAKILLALAAWWR